jgi:chorismate synthase
MDYEVTYSTRNRWRSDRIELPSGVKTEKTTAPSAVQAVANVETKHDDVQLLDVKPLLDERA